MTNDIVVGALVLVFLLVAAALLWRWLWRTRRRPAPYGANPNTSHITEAMWWLWTELEKLEPGSALGGIYANKPGYHNCRSNLPDYDYSVTDDPPDQGGPSWAGAAIDWTFPDAQAGDYSTIAKYTQRLLASAQDIDDPRLDGWREFYGNADSDEYVEGWDCRYGCPATSDSSHLWHIHASENRDQTESYDNKRAFLSVLRGETVDQWLYGEAQLGAGVLLNCPFDKTRQDFLYVGPNGEVHHVWFGGGMYSLWTGAGSRENLGGNLVQGTLDATWNEGASELDITGLGPSDTDDAPAGCGKFWGYTLGRGGQRSGWGSLEHSFGPYPSPPQKVTYDNSQIRVVGAIAVFALMVGLTALMWLVGSS